MRRILVVSVFVLLGACDDDNATTNQVDAGSQADGRGPNIPATDSGGTTAPDGSASVDTPCGPSGKTTWGIAGTPTETMLYKISLDVDGWDVAVGDVKLETKNPVALSAVTVGCDGLCAHSGTGFYRIDLGSFDGKSFTAIEAGMPSKSLRGLSPGLVAAAGGALITIALNPYTQGTYASPTYPACSNNGPVELSDVQEGVGGAAWMTANCGGSNVGVVVRLNGGNITLTHELVGDRYAGLHGSTFAATESGKIYDISGGALKLHRTTRVCAGPPGNPINGTSIPLRALD